jgi:hypothetical protein
MFFKVFEHLTNGFAFFELHESWTVSLADSHLQRMVEHLGDFPQNFLAKCSRRAEYFNEKGEQSKTFPICITALTGCLQETFSVYRSCFRAPSKNVSRIMIMSGIRIYCSYCGIYSGMFDH